MRDNLKLAKRALTVALRTQDRLDSGLYFSEAQVHATIATAEDVREMRDLLRQLVEIDAEQEKKERA